MLIQVVSDCLEGMPHHAMLDVNLLIYEQADRTEKSCDELEHALEVIQGLDRDDNSEQESDLAEVVKELRALVVQLRQGGALVDEFRARSHSTLNKTTLRLESLS